MKRHYQGLPGQGRGTAGLILPATAARCSDSQAEAEVAVHADLHGPVQVRVGPEWGQAK